MLPTKRAGLVLKKLLAPPYLLLAVLILGLVLRIRAFTAFSSLTYDEALLALNIVERSFSRLFLPLENNQGAPLGFLFVSKLALQLLGNRDYVLKLFPTVCALVSLPLFYHFSRRFPPIAALTALALFAVSEPLVFFGITFKQYSGDAAVCLGLLVLATAVFSGKPDRKRWAAWGLASTFSIWFSHPAVFVVAGASLVAAIRILRNKDWRSLLSLCLSSLGWAASLALITYLSLTDLAGNQNLLNYWQNAFMPLPPWRDPLWFQQALKELIFHTLSPAPTWLVAALLLVGAFSLLRQDRLLTALLLVPVLLTLLASGLKLYPFSARLLLFLAPVVALLAGFGVAQLYTWLKPYPWFAAGAVVLVSALLLYRPGLSAAARVQHPAIIEHSRPVIQYLDRQWKWGDAIYVYYGAEPAFRYYNTSLYGLKDRWVHYGVYAYNEPEKLLKDLQPSMEEKRLWLVFTHVGLFPEPLEGSATEEQFLLAHMNKVGKMKDSFHSQGASVYLYRTGVDEPLSPSD